MLIFMGDPTYESSRLVKYGFHVYSPQTILEMAPKEFIERIVKSMWYVMATFGYAIKYTSFLDISKVAICANYILDRQVLDELVMIGKPAPGTKFSFLLVCHAWTCNPIIVVVSY